MIMSDLRIFFEKNTKKERAKWLRFAQINYICVSNNPNDNSGASCTVLQEQILPNMTLNKALSISIYSPSFTVSRGLCQNLMLSGLAFCYFC